MARNSWLRQPTYTVLMLTVTAYAAIALSWHCKVVPWTAGPAGLREHGNGTCGLPAAAPFKCPDHCRAYLSVVGCVAVPVGGRVLGPTCLWSALVSVHARLPSG